MSKECVVELCGNDAMARGLCNPCYTNWTQNHKIKGRSSDWFIRWRSIRKRHDAELHELMAEELGGGCDALHT